MLYVLKLISLLNFCATGVWLAYIQFEKHHGDPLQAGSLITRAEQQLNAEKAYIFRELNLIIRQLGTEVSLFLKYSFR